MSIEQNKETVRRFAQGQWVSRNVDIFDELVAPNATIAGMSRDKRKDWLRDLHTRAPEVTLKIEEMIAEGDTVVYRWTVHGRHTHEMLTPYGSAAPTGREITLTGISITHLRDGKIVEEILHGDDLGYCQQMGVIPTPGKST